MAIGVLRRARRPDGRPEAWLAAAFGRDVDLIRTHLGPIGSRPVLAASFGRESFHGGWAAMTDARGPVTVAYAIRWLELGDRVARPSFAAWLAESAPTPSRRVNAGSVLEPVTAG